MPAWTRRGIVLWSLAELDMSTWAYRLYRFPSVTETQDQGLRTKKPITSITARAFIEFVEQDPVNRPH